MQIQTIHLTTGGVSTSHLTARFYSHFAPSTISGVMTNHEASKSTYPDQGPAGAKSGSVDLRGRNHRCIARADTNANARKNEKKKDEKCGGSA